MLQAALATALGVAGDPIAQVALWLGIILIAAKLGGELAGRLGQPAVLGELLAGVVLGNLDLLGYPGLEPMSLDPTIDMLARLGVLILLFEVGLESTVGQMLAVGRTAMVVAVLGVVAPFGLGWLCGAWLVPEAGPYVHAFLGATLCATSVGITARVLRDLGRSQSQEARVILGAAVIDDVLGLVVLASVSGAILSAAEGGVFGATDIALVAGKAAFFLVGALVLGVRYTPRLFAAAARLRTPHVLLALGLSFCFTLSWLAGVVGLAAIVGAFAAGLILEEVHYQDFKTDDGNPHELEELLEPISAFLTPVFFILMGMRTDLRSFAAPGVLGLAAALTVAAIVGKQACMLAVPRGALDRLTIGLGMVPRGEVGLIFANAGTTLRLAGQPVISGGTYSALVVMVIVTTLATPPALKWSLGRRGGLA